MERMEKDEILRRAQRQKEDERVAQVYQRSYHISMTVGLTACLVLVFIKVILAGESARDVMGLYFTMTAASSFYNWYQLREGRDLVWACIGAVFALTDLMLYFTPLLR